MGGTDTCRETENGRDAAVALKRARSISQYPAGRRPLVAGCTLPRVVLRLGLPWPGHIPERIRR